MIIISNSEKPLSLKALNGECNIYNANETFKLSIDQSFWGKKTGIKVCIHEPKCSEYTYQAVEKHGVIKGSVMGFFRILRCNPYNKGGFDPVPEKFTIKKSL